MPSHVAAIVRALAASATLTIAVEPSLAQSDPLLEVRARGTFEDVKQQLVLAIENRGLIVNHESKVGEMLERTGKDLGAKTRIYARAEVLEFCSAPLSRQAMEVDARLLALCPYGVGIFTLPGETDQVHLVYRHPPALEAGPAASVLREVDRLLREIVQEAGQ